MIQVVIEEGTPPVPVWLDVSNPTRAELEGLAEKYKFHANLVQDCIEPGHLPKYEKHAEATFVILRAYDVASRPMDDNFLTMTSKFAVFLGDRFLICVHRRQHGFLEAIQAKYRTGAQPAYLQMILLEILMAAVETYHKPLEEAEVQVQTFESSVLRGSQVGSWEDVFRTKCRLMVIKRMLWHSLNTVQKFVPYSNANLPLCQDLKERIESLQFFVDSLLDDIDSLLNIQMSLASHRTNDVMRVLTVFSAFFLPINFIVGVYGMNFEWMPELKMRWGYPLAWVAILATVGGIFWFFRRKGWLK